MRFSITALVVGLFTCKSLGGSLQVIDDNRECKIYSSDNHGCTGYSAPFAKLDGDDCSNLSFAYKNSRIGLSFVDIGACGMSNGKNVAWIQVDRTGEVTFFNQNGDKAKCQLDNGLKTGSSCTAVDTDTSTSASTTQSESNSSTSTTSSTPTTSSSSATTTTTTTESAASTCACT